MTDLRRQLPSVGKLLETREVLALLELHPRTVVVDALRRVIDEARNTQVQLTDANLGVMLSARIAEAVRPTLQRVINATGVVLHTNLGRAPLAACALDAIATTSAGYSNLEYNIAEGARGSRYSHCVELLKELTGAEDAVVVNNCAAALVLALNTLSFGKDAIISRGELVEIGGSFRIPEIMRGSGANLVEIGTTNRTHVDDYIRASGPNTGAFVKVHRSNFTLKGFVAEVGIDRLAPIANERDIPVIHDLGSGLLIPLDALGLTGEPLASEAVRAGATLVLMSGDKLVGGPQAGIIVGKSSVISRLRTNPLMRAFRVDKLTIAALSATLQLYREPANAIREVPILRMLAQSPAELEQRAVAVRDALLGRGTEAKVVSSLSTVGAGAFPGSELASFAVAVGGDVPLVEARLRSGTPAVIARIENNTLILDMRSVLPEEDLLLIDLLAQAAA